MGGQEAIRGFTYQTIISVIHSLAKKDWDFVTVEPHMEDDKVDILWETKDYQKNCQQVKSSVNNFNKSSIENWIHAMQEAVPGAELYQLTLVGYISSGIENYIKELQENKKINIEVITLNTDILESTLRDELTRFLYNNGFNIDHGEVVKIAMGLTYQFLKFSTIGAKISKNEFSEIILQWIKGNYNKALRPFAGNRSFSVLLYEPGSKEFQVSAQLKKFSFKGEPLWKELTEEIKNKYKEGLKINIGPKKQLSLEELKKYILQLSENNEGPFPAELLDFEKEKISSALKKYHGIDVDSSYYNVGEILRKKPTIITFYQGNEYAGTDDEIKKRKILDSLSFKIQIVSEFEELIKFLNSKYYLQLVLQNEGDIYDEEIEVELTFPGSVSLVTAENFPTPKSLVLLQHLVKSRIIMKELRTTENSIIKKFEEEPFQDIDGSGDMETILGMPFGGGSQLRDLFLDKFNHQIEHRMNFKLYEDQFPLKKFQFTFKKVNPNSRMAFPCYLLLDTQKDFIFTYSVKTKNSSQMYYGEISCGV